MDNLVRYVVAREGEELPPIKASLYEYVLAANGVFVRGRRDGMEACVPVGGVLQRVRGLRELEPYCTLDYPRVPAGALEVVLSYSRDVCEREPVEALFHFTNLAGEARSLNWDPFDGSAPSLINGSWRLDIPAQDGSCARVKPLEDGPGTSYATSIVEVHSHHAMEAFFSGTDNKDKQGFKLYGVLGRIFSKPTLRLRVGIYGHFMEFPASEVFELPPEISDAVAPFADARKCRVCGCTEDDPCQEGCWWVDWDLCSECQEQERALIEAAGFPRVIDEGHFELDQASGLWLPSGGVV